jgi:acetylornithine deacetylase/succinyl-diaminopimelate desuccinylase family protein
LNNDSSAMEILKDLVGIQSVNPAFSEEARGEGEVADYVERRCTEAGLEVHRQQVLPGRENVIAELRAGKPDSTLVFEAHMDTVALGSMEDPLTPKLSGKRLYGRGACDTKASLAAMLCAIEECARDPESLSSDIVLCAAVDEEYAYRGVLAFLEADIPAAGAIVGEPTDLRTVVAHKGSARFRLTTRGKAAHTSVPHEGKNAIYQMVNVLQAIVEGIEPSLAEHEHPMCGPPTIAVGTIQGGTQINTVPEECAIQVDRRVIPGEDARTVLDDLVSTLDQRSGESFEVEELLLDWPLDTPVEAEIVRCAGQTATTLGLEATPMGVTYGSDASKLQRLGGIPSIVVGPGSIEQAHSREEWVDTDQVELVARFYAEIARVFGQHSGRGSEPT